MKLDLHQLRTLVSSVPAAPTSVEGVCGLGRGHGGQHSKSGCDRAARWVWMTAPIYPTTQWLVHMKQSFQVSSGNLSVLERMLLQIWQWYGNSAVSQSVIVFPASCKVLILMLVCSWRSLQHVFHLVYLSPPFLRFERAIHHHFTSYYIPVSSWLFCGFIYFLF